VDLSYQLLFKFIVLSRRRSVARNGWRNLILMYNEWSVCLKSSLVKNPAMNLQFRKLMFVRYYACICSMIFVSLATYVTVHSLVICHMENFACSKTLWPKNNFLKMCFFLFTCVNFQLFWCFQVVNIFIILKSLDELWSLCLIIHHHPYIIIQSFIDVSNLHLWTVETHGFKVPRFCYWLLGDVKLIILLHTIYS
jgi:hypothetical protein